MRQLPADNVHAGDDHAMPDHPDGRPERTRRNGRRMSQPMLDALAVSARNRLVRHWPLEGITSRLTRPIVSFTFDDFPRSAATTGARILEASGWRGTYYISGILADSTVDGVEYFRTQDLPRLVAAGHEIGCHTFDHVRLPGMPRSLIERSVLRNRQFMRAAIAADFTPSSFAFPYGDISLASKWQLQAHYPVCRWILPQVNRATIDLGRLSAFPIETRDLDMARIASALDDAARCNGWVIFFTHDVSEAPTPYGCQTAAFETIVGMVRARGIEVAPVTDAAARVRSN